MKRTDLRIGAEYALGSNAQRERYMCARARLLDPAAVPALSAPIVVELLTPGPGWPYHGAVGGRVALKSARDLEPWDEYLVRKAHADEAVRAREAERERKNTIIEQVHEILTRRYGLSVGGWGAPVRGNTHDGTITFDAETLLELLTHLDLATPDPLNPERTESP